MRTDSNNYESILVTCKIQSLFIDEYIQPALLGKNLLMQ